MRYNLILAISVVHLVCSDKNCKEVAVSGFGDPDLLRCEWPGRASVAADGRFGSDRARGNEICR